MYSDCENFVCGDCFFLNFWKLIIFIFSIFFINYWSKKGKFHGCESGIEETSWNYNDRTFLSSALISHHSCMPSPLAPDPIRVQPHVCCLFWTNRNSMAETSIFLSISLSNPSISAALSGNGNMYFYWNYGSMIMKGDEGVTVFLSILLCKAVHKF